MGWVSWQPIPFQGGVRVLCAMRGRDLWRLRREGEEEEEEGPHGANLGREEKWVRRRCRHFWGWVGGHSFSRSRLMNRLLALCTLAEGHLELHVCTK